MKVLHLTLKNKWFDLIASGEKTEEYREIKPYWISRLCNNLFSAKPVSAEDFLRWFDNKGSYVSLNHVGNDFEVVTFRNGYSAGAPKVTMVYRGLILTEGKREWGAEPGKKYFVIKLGEKI